MISADPFGWTTVDDEAPGLSCPRLQLPRPRLLLLALLVPVVGIVLQKFVRNNSLYKKNTCLSAIEPAMCAVEYTGDRNSDIHLIPESKSSERRLVNGRQW